MAKKETPTAHPRPLWRSWEHEPGEDLVEMPRALALDLLRLVSVDPFLYEASDEDCEAGLHESRYQSHRDRMGKIMGTLSIHLTHEVETITPELLLRSLVMAYETAPDIQRATA